MMHLASCPHLNRKTHIACTFVQICDLRICVNWLFRWPTICSAFSPCHIPKCMHHVPILFSAVFQSIIRLYYVYRHMCMGMSAHTALYRSTHTHRYAFPKNHSGKLAKYHLMLFDQHERWCSACRDVMLVAISYLPNLCLLFACAYWLANGKTHIHAINWLTKPTTHSMFQINVH